MNTDYGIAATTFSDPETGQRLAEGLLEKRLAACVQTLPIHSAYRKLGAKNRSDAVRKWMLLRGMLPGEDLQ